MAYLSLVWNEVFYRPIYNFLIWLVSVVPGHELGLGIIILTIVIRLILLVPTYRSLSHQKSLQELQPKIKALKEKHKDDQQQLAQETMKLYKEHGVNPCGSCLPLIIQMPFLIAVFQVLRSGLDQSSAHLLYPFLSSFDLGVIDVMFFGRDLTQPEKFVLPLLVTVLTFGSMKLSQARQQKKVHDITPHGSKKEPKTMQEMEIATKMMTYMMPIMIGYFAMQYPAGLALYWTIATLFSVFQQLVLNKRREALDKTEPLVKP